MWRIISELRDPRRTRASRRRSLPGPQWSSAQLWDKLPLVAQASQADLISRSSYDGTVSWFAGVDWGSERHHVCLLDAAGPVVGARAFRHGGAGLAALCDWLVSVAGEPGRVTVAIEVPHGPVVDALLDRGFAVHAINPKQLERLRDRVSLAGAKDDRRDAWVGAGGLRTDPYLFRPV